ncbi:MAG: lamin tail domain-containing protein [Planctomycetes bacterium]|nr:lamin tail domain-containing protein [Planctomycetota bacterium]MCB9885006.1 lamin tail domain-containing protein [Planctomycetota bacterium]
MLATSLCAFALAFCPQGGEGSPPVGMTVVVVDVGQGDGIVLRAPDGTVHVVDAGPDGQGIAAVLPAITALQPTGYGNTFLSHFHDDHQGGMDEVLTARPFVFAYDRGDLRRTNTSAATNGYLSAAGARRRTATPGLVVQLGGGATLTCIAADGHVLGGAFVDPISSAQEENSRSLVFRLDYRDFSMWLGGDLTGGGNSTSDVESPASLACGDVDVYKLNHHGSNTSTSTNLVTRLSPELAVVSCGVGNSYGHPTPTIVNRLNQAAAARALLCTTSGSASIVGFGVVGNLRIDSDGERYRATAQNGDYLDFYCDEVAPTTLAAGDVRISEVHRDPAAVADTNGEYVELVNVSARPVGLMGVTLADNAASVTLASNLLLIPGKPLVVQVDGAPTRNGGLPLGATLPYNTLALGNSGDVLAVTQGATTVDALTYSSSLPGGAGVASERRDLLGAQTNGNYAAAVTAFGLGDRGSPGRRNDADSTAHPVQVAVSSRPGSFTLHGTALANGSAAGTQWSAIGIAYGASPGFPLLGVVVPLAQDPLLSVFLGVPGAVAPLPAGGYRSLRVALPTPNPLAGVPLYAAHVVLDLGTLAAVGVSSAVPFQLQ